MFFIAAPFVLNPFYKIRSIQFRASDATPATLDTMQGWNFPHDANKNLHGEGFIPDNFQAGTDVQIVINGATQVINDTGSEKIVVLNQYIYRGRDGVAGEVTVIPDKTEIVIPNNNPAKTFQVAALNVISGLVAGDFFTWTVQRKTTDEDDTWASFWWMSHKVCVKYIADKVGVEV